MCEITKNCKSCNLDKCLEDFHKHHKTKDGRVKECRECVTGLKNSNGQKECFKCHSIKSTEEFHNCESCSDGKSPICKVCNIIKSKNNYINNTEYIKGYVKTWANNNKDKRAIYCKKDYDNGGKERNKAYNRLHSKKIYAAKKHRMELDKDFKMSMDFRSTLRKAFNRACEGKYKKSKKTEEILGCTIAEFLSHIESQFESWMNWDNHSDLCKGEDYNCSWDLDHIIPISWATTENEIFALNHYSNFQPLCAKINRHDKRGKVYPVCNTELNLTAY